MTPELRCPSCGQLNDSALEECANCSFPLHLGKSGVAASAEVPAPEPAPVAPAAPAPPPPPAPEPVPARPAQAFDPNIRRVRPVRPRPPRSPQEALQLQLWLVLGGIAVLIIMYTAFKGFQQNNAPSPQQVAGANEEMQHAATMARGELAKDSTNVNARIMLANILYDTANWSEAIIHYRSALRSEPNKVTTLVDLGVCYFNLGSSDDAVVLFQKALALEPNHPVALFNMGVVRESQNQFNEALDFYGRASRAKDVPAPMLQGLAEATQRVKDKMSGAPPAMGGGR